MKKKFCKCKKPKPGRCYVGGYEWWECQKCKRRIENIMTLIKYK